MGDDAVPGDRRVVRVVNFIAAAMGLTAEHTAVRYALLFVSLACLAVAAFFFGPANVLGAAAALSLAFFAVVFVVVFWFFEERRKRRIMLGKERPLKRDALNPDFRDEAIAACMTLFILVPLALQTFNREMLHFDVVPERLGLPPAACGTSGAPPCGELQRLVQLPPWILFTVRSFVLTTPVGDVASQSAPDDTGVSPTAKTPREAVDYGLKILFVGFIGSLFGGLYQRVGGQMRDAVENLSISHEYAAALGPIMLKPLSDVIERNGDGDERVVTNALRALSSIAERYPQARGSMVEMFERTLTNEVSVGIELIRHREVGTLQRLEATADVLCRIESATGIGLVRDRAARPGESYVAKRQLVRVLVRTLDVDALPHLDALLRRNPMPGMKREVDRLMRELKPGSDDGSV